MSKYRSNRSSIHRVRGAGSGFRSGAQQRLKDRSYGRLSLKDFKANPRLITEAKGVYLKTHHGKTQIDASSGLFCNPLGHGRKEITEAVTKQLETLDYAQPFQQGFGGSFELASKIAKHTPGDLNKMFFRKRY